MDIDFFRTYALQLSGVEETLPFGPDNLVFKVNNKMFLLLPLDASPISFNVKCNPDAALELREQYPTSVLPGYHMNKKTLEHYCGRRRFICAAIAAIHYRFISFGKRQQEIE